MVQKSSIQHGFTIKNLHNNVIIIPSSRNIWFPQTKVSLFIWKTYRSINCWKSLLMLLINAIKILMTDQFFKDLGHEWIMLGRNAKYILILLFGRKILKIIYCLYSTIGLTKPNFDIKPEYTYPNQTRTFNIHYT